MSSCSSERFKDLSAAVQSCVVSIAVLVGGGWTLYTFIATDEAEQARRRLFQQAQILIKITASYLPFEEKKHCIASVVAITNTGTRDVFLDYSNGPYSVAKVAFDARGNSSLGPELRQKSLFSQSRVLRSGETVEYPFFVRVEEPGVYVVRFQVPLPEKEMPLHVNAGGPKGKIYWIGTTFVNVEPPGAVTLERRSGPGLPSALGNAMGTVPNPAHQRIRPAVDQHATFRLTKRTFPEAGWPSSHPSALKASSLASLEWGVSLFCLESLPFPSPLRP
jgi:hypothetical protein